LHNFFGVDAVGDENYFDKSKGMELLDTVEIAVTRLCTERKISESEYGQVIPELEEYTKEPPGLPPHLRHIILNKVCGNGTGDSSNCFDCSRPPLTIRWLYQFRNMLHSIIYTVLPSRTA
jgi:hypothetical protein